MSTAVEEYVQASAAPSGLMRQMPEESDAELPRFMFMPTFDICVRHQPTSAYLGNWPDELIPKRVLLKIDRTVAYGINELPAQITSNEADFEQDYLPSPDALEGRSNSKVWKRTPKFVANTLLRQYEQVGLTHFDRMNGKEALANRLFAIILPQGCIAVTTRIREDEEFTGPFLDELREYVLKVSPRNLRQAALSPEDREQAGIMLRQLTEGVARAWTYQGVVFTKTDNLIRQKRNGGEGKEWYDQRDQRFMDSRPPQDLLFMADLNRQPLDLKELEAAKVMTDGATSAVVQGVKEGIKEALASQHSQQQPQGIDPSAVKAMIDQALEDHGVKPKKKAKPPNVPRQTQAPNQPSVEIVAGDGEGETEEEVAEEETSEE